MKILGWMSATLLASLFLAGCESGPPPTSVEQPTGLATLTSAAIVDRLALTPAKVGDKHRIAMRDLLDNMDAYTGGRARTPAVACGAGLAVARKHGRDLGISEEEIREAFARIRFCRAFGGLSVANRLRDYFATSAFAAAPSEPWEPYSDAMLYDLEHTTDASPAAVAAIVSSHLSAASGSLISADYDVLDAVGEVINGGMDEYSGESWAYHPCDEVCDIQFESVVSTSALPAVFIYKLIKVALVDAIACAAGAKAADQGEKLAGCVAATIPASAIAIIMVA